MNERIEVRESYAGAKKVVAIRNLFIGDPVYTLDISNVTDRDMHTIELKIKGNIVHVLDPIFKYAHHSFSPSVHIDYTTGEVFAITDIYAHEEITFNYLTTESEISHPFKDYLTGLKVTK